MVVKVGINNNTRFQSVVSNAYDKILFIDSNGTVQYLTYTLILTFLLFYYFLSLNLHRYASSHLLDSGDPKELLGTNIADWIVSNNRALKSNIELVFSTKNSQKFEAKYSFKDLWFCVTIALHCHQSAVVILHSILDIYSLPFLILTIFSKLVFFN